MDVTVAVATHGDHSWRQLAGERAVPSAALEDVPVVAVHRPDGTLAQARNDALDEVQTEWVIFLDADDELEPGYIEAMAAGTADVRGPIVRYTGPPGRPDRLWQPRVWRHHHTCEAECLREGNWLVIGSAVRADLVRHVGGFREFAWSEDWDLWCRCWKAGATFELLVDAVYKAHVRNDSRNRAPSADARNRAHEAIYAANFA